MTTIQQTCAHCREIFVIRRDPAQHYCHQKACQQVRKNLWRQNQRAQDEDYRENQCRANQHSRKKHPDYWRHYRQTPLVISNTTVNYRISVTKKARQTSNDTKFRACK